MAASPHLAALERDGFVVVPKVVAGEKLEALRAAASKATALARAGTWPHVRTVGKQFPPWEARADTGIWGVQHLMNPELAGSELFTQFYFSEAPLSIVKELLQCGDDQLVMELFNMLVRPERDFELRWHRDDIPAEARPEEEMERLGRPAWHAQYNMALWEDDSLVLVPGSHKRPRTETERQAGPYEATLPGQMVVRLGPGDIAFYNNNILHRYVLCGAVVVGGGSGRRAADSSPLGAQGRLRLDQGAYDAARIGGPRRWQRAAGAQRAAARGRLVGGEVRLERPGGGREGARRGDAGEAGGDGPRPRRRRVFAGGVRMGTVGGWKRGDVRMKNWRTCCVWWPACPAPPLPC